ncbi:MAG TPA: hypothetical protein DCL15_20650 [Chloroflexi bacterium]|nr:hypothetical protein [Chloroflexota bacterium]
MFDSIARRQLALPALLFLTALQPLYFVTGHLLFAIAPLASLLGVEQVGAWGERLSDPDAIATWRRRLIQAADETWMAWKSERHTREERA